MSYVIDSTENYVCTVVSKAFDRIQQFHDRTKTKTFEFAWWDFHRNEFCRISGENRFFESIQSRVYQSLTMQKACQLAPIKYATAKTRFEKHHQIEET